MTTAGPKALKGEHVFAMYTASNTTTVHLLVFKAARSFPIDFIHQMVFGFYPQNTAVSGGSVVGANRPETTRLKVRNHRKVY